MDSNAVNPDDINYIKRVKMAVAVAVIRNKPKDKSAEEYAKELRDTIQKREENWKTEAKRLKIELLSAKQELLKLKAEERISGQLGGNETVIRLSENFLTPPCSSETITEEVENPKTEEIHKEFRNNTRFLHCTTCLHNSDKNNATLKTTEAIDVLERSMSSVVDYLLKHFDEVPVKDVDWAVEGFLKVVCSELNDKEKKLERNCWRLVQGLLKEALVGAHNKSYERRQKIITEIVKFCKVKSILVPTLKVLVHQIVKLSDMLRKHINKQCNLNVVQYENGCNAFDILEQLLSLSVTWNYIKGDVATMIKNQLESSLLHVTDYFPLFAHYVWKVCSYLNEKE